MTSNWNSHFDFAADTEHTRKRFAGLWPVEFAGRLPGSCMKLHAILSTLRFRFVLVVDSEKVERTKGGGPQSN